MRDFFRPNPAPDFDPSEGLPSGEFPVASTSPDRLEAAAAQLTEVSASALAFAGVETSYPTDSVGFRHPRATLAAKEQSKRDIPELSIATLTSRIMEINRGREPMVKRSLGQSARRRAA